MDFRTPTLIPWGLTSFDTFCWSMTSYYRWLHMSAHPNPSIQLWLSPSFPSSLLKQNWNIESLLIEKGINREYEVQKYVLQREAEINYGFIWKKKKSLDPSVLQLPPWKNGMELNKHTLQKERRVSWLNKEFEWYKQSLFNIRVLPASSMKIC